MVFFLLISKYGIQDIGFIKNLLGKLFDVLFIKGFDGCFGGVYRFCGCFDSFIEFLNNGWLDIKDFIIIFVYVNLQLFGFIFNYDFKGFGMYVWMVCLNIFFVCFVKRDKMLI